MLGVAQEVDVGLRAPVERQPRLASEALEGAVGPLLAEIARDGGAQIVDDDAAPGTGGSSARSAPSVGADEGRRLQPLEGVRRPQQREADIGERR